MTLAVGVDIGGTKIAAGVVDASGRILEHVRAESPAEDSAAIEETVADLVAGLRRTHAVEAVGVAAAGFVARERGHVYFAPNLDLGGVDLGEDLRRAIGLPVVVENDASAAAWAEHRYGAGRGGAHLLMLTIGTGVGGGVVTDGRLLRGAFGIGGEVGHVRLVADGELCGCGVRGCLEAYASGTALVDRARAALRAASDPRAALGLLALAGGDPGAVTGPMITEAAQAGDAFATERLAELGTFLGQGIATLAAVLDPGLVVLGGGVADAGDLLLEPARAAYRANLPGRGRRPEAEFRLAELGNDAGMVGAATLALSR